ncbi:MAG: AsmA-like C-terminal region-containing protein [Candidatus Riflebacteria bacterium]
MQKNKISSKTDISRGFTILLLLLVCSLANAQSDFQKQIEKKISDFAGMPVSIGEFSLEYTTVKLRKVTVGSNEKPDKPHILVDSMSASCDFMSLLGGNLVLNDLSISSMTATIRGKAGKNFLNQSDKNKAESTQSFADLPFLKVNAENLTLNFSEIAPQRYLLVKLKKLDMVKGKTEAQLSGTIEGFLESGMQTPARSVISSDFKLSIKASGKLSEPVLDGTLALANLSAADPSLKQPVIFSGTEIKFSQKTAELKETSGSWQNSKVFINGNVLDMSARSFDFSFRISPLVLQNISDNFMPAEGLRFDGTGNASGKITGSRNEFRMSGLVDFPNAGIIVPVESKSKDFFKFPFKNVKAAYSYSNKKLIISDGRAEIFGGQLNGKGEIHTARPPVRFNADVTATGLMTEQFLSENSTQKNVISGPLNAQLTATGDTSGLKSWNGNGSMNMQKGRYQTPPVVTPVLKMINLAEFASGEIESGNGTFKLQQGILHTDDLNFQAQAGKAFYRGQVGLDTRLDGKMTLLFSGEAVKKSQVLQQISLDGSSADISTKVEGTLLAPVFPGFSPEKLLEFGLKRKGQKLLIDILKPKSKKSEDSNTQQEQPKKDPGKKILKDLQKIFKF